MESLGPPVFLVIKKWPSVYRSFGNFIFSKIVDNFVIYQEWVCGNWVIWCFESFFLIIKRNTIWKEWVWSFGHLVFWVIHLKMIGHLVLIIQDSYLFIESFGVMKHYFLGLLVILEMLKYSSQFVTFKVSGHWVIWCFWSFCFFWNKVFGHWQSSQRDHTEFPNTCICSGILLFPLYRFSPYPVGLDK